jgi:hypothetical protein
VLVEIRPPRRLTGKNAVALTAAADVRERVRKETDE